MDNLEEDLTCSVCYSLFSDPRVLPCSHTFCKSCLDNLLQVSTNYSIWRPLRLPLKCPNCRSVVELPLSGVDALPTNVSLRAIIEKYQMDSEPRPPSCQEHHRQPLNMYCIQDRHLICGLCLTVGQHQGHPIDDLQAAFIREKRTPSLLLAKLSEKRWAQVCELGEQLEQEKARCEAVVREDRQEVDHFFLTLEGLLARKKQAYMEALDKVGAEVTQAFNPTINKVKELQEEQLDLVSLGSSVEDEDSPLVFLEKGSKRCNTEGRSVWTEEETILKNKHLVKFDHYELFHLPSYYTYEEAFLKVVKDSYQICPLSPFLSCCEPFQYHSVHQQSCMCVSHDKTIYCGWSSV
ncbi:tripartite motif-containing protein 59 isoform 2-T2 [Pholidichthys leucotaenia]